MFNGAHFLLYSTNADADRAFFRDVLGFGNVDVGEGWLIFALPPAELAVHPGGGEFVQAHADHSMAGVVLYLMCQDLQQAMNTLSAKKVACTPPMEAEWGTATSIRLPSGAHIGLYQPKHPTAINVGQA
jgi:hypothetical protein